MDRTAAYYSGPSFHYSGNGGAFGVYSGSRRQRGGGIFGSLARLILPVASSVGKRILRQGARTAIDLTKNVVSDALEGKNVGPVNQGSWEKRIEKPRSLRPHSKYRRC